jgi:sugar lactone lactonase YvrE
MSDEALTAAFVDLGRTDVLAGTAEAGLMFPESPRWIDGELVFSDMEGGAIHRLSQCGELGIVAPVLHGPSGLGCSSTGELWVVSMRDNLLLGIEGGKTRLVAKLGRSSVGMCNDMIVTPDGRAYVGDIGYTPLDGDQPPLKPRGNILLVTSEGVVTMVAAGLDCPNGLVLSPDGSRLFVAETFGHRISAFEVGADGLLSDCQTVACLPSAPDGMCGDDHGGLWIALPDLGEILRIGLDGHRTHRVRTVGRPLACVLGGVDRMTLFVCSVLAGDSPDSARRGGRGAIESIRVPFVGAGAP